MPDDLIADLASRLQAAIEFARNMGEVHRDNMAAALWEQIYGELSAGRPGLRGAILNRAETQVVRLSLTYSLMDSSHTVSVGHLKAALALWDYVEASVSFIFGEAIGNPDADRIIEALRQSPDRRMSDDDIGTGVFKGHGTGKKAVALAELERLGRVRQEKVATNGRPRTEWVLAS